MRSQGLPPAVPDPLRAAPLRERTAPPRRFAAESNAQAYDQGRVPRVGNLRNLLWKEPSGLALRVPTSDTRSIFDDCRRRIGSGQAERGDAGPDTRPRNRRARRGGARRQDARHDPHPGGRAGLRARGPDPAAWGHGRAHAHQRRQEHALCGPAEQRRLHVHLAREPFQGNGDDKTTHGASLRRTGDYMFIWLVTHSRGGAPLERDGRAYYWYAPRRGNEGGRGLPAAIVVSGDPPPEARIDRPPQPRP